MLTFNIRLATREDESAIQHVIRTVYEEYNWPWDPKDYHRDLYDIDEAYFAKGGYFWVAELDGEVVGTTALEVFKMTPFYGHKMEGIVWTDEDGKTHFPGMERKDPLVWVDHVIRCPECDCSLERLYLLPQGRGKGYGAAMFQHTVEHAKEIGCQRMEIWSDKKLTMAHKLYEKFGARRIGERLCHDPDQSPEWGMIIDLI